MTVRRNDGAFPVSYNRQEDAVTEGMTKREYFALILMQGLTISNVPFEDVYQKARAAVLEADALIAVLNE